MPLAAIARTPGAVDVIWSVTAVPSDVWQHLTDPTRLHEWLGQHVSGGFAPGDELVVDHGEGYLCRSRVTTVEPGCLLSMSWEFPDEPASHVTITADDAPAGEEPVSHVRLRHEHLGDLADSYLPGWITHLTYAEASLHGAPLPSDSFWRLYETVQHLVRVPESD